MGHDDVDAVRGIALPGLVPGPYAADDENGNSDVVGKLHYAATLVFSGSFLITLVGFGPKYIPHSMALLNIDLNIVKSLFTDDGRRVCALFAK